jgi:dienelactone hydrolase
VRLRRGRSIPEAQVLDIRNAITYIQGEPGVDATRIGVVGYGLAGAHVVAVAANDARVTAGVTITAERLGDGFEKRSYAPPPEILQLMIKLARTADAANGDEARVALAEYKPFRYLDQIPKTTAMLHLQGRGDLITAAADFLAKALLPK